MDGKELLYKLRNLLSEDASSGFLDNKTSYQYLWDAATEFVERTNCIKSEQSISTIADQEDYTLDASYLKMSTRNKDKEFIVKYNDGSVNTFLIWKPYDDVITEDSTASAEVPSHFVVLDDDKDSLVTGTTTSAGVSSGGEATLTDTAADFSDVNPGDYVHNTADGSDGVVLSKTSSTVLVTALFGGTANDYTSGDSYVIQPQGRLKIKIVPPPANSADTITVYYVKKPDPVFSDYGIYPFQQNFASAIVPYAAWMYKYRDSAPDFGNAWFLVFDRAVGQANGVYNSSVSKNNFTVSFKNRNGK